MKKYAKAPSSKQNEIIRKLDELRRQNRPVDEIFEMLKGADKEELARIVKIWLSQSR
jgi:hypothetical protein